MLDTHDGTQLFLSPYLGLNNNYNQAKIYARFLSSGACWVCSAGMHTCLCMLAAAPVVCSLLWQPEHAKEEQAWQQQIEEQQEQQDIIWQQPESTVWPDQNDEGDGWQGGYGPLTVQVSVSKSIASVCLYLYVYICIFICVYICMCTLCRLAWLLGLRMRMVSDSSWR